MIKYFRIRKREKAQKKEKKKLEKEQKKIVEKHKEEEYKKDLERLKEKALKYVLTMSAPAYVEGVGRKLTDYEFRNISVRGEYGKYSIYEGCLERMTREGEKINAEIIVDVRLSENEYRSGQMGTALIPKKKK